MQKSGDGIGVTPYCKSQQWRDWYILFSDAGVYLQEI